jgi:PTH1 family peptidyl-tRNA hydrolase
MTNHNPTYIIFGLGNPGPEYKNTRHNAGFWCVEFLAEKFGFPVFSRNNKNVMISTGIIAGRPVALVKPRTFVNNSGHAIETGLKKFHVGIDGILIISDDITLPPGKIRLRKEGGSGGHNGLKSIIEILGSNEFARLRIGVGDVDEGSLVDHVLSPLPKESAKLVNEALVVSGAAIELLLTKGLSEAMNIYN